MSSDGEVNDLDFYQQDFTTASKWEVFTSQLEELFRTTWHLNNVNHSRRKLHKDELSTCEWDQEMAWLTYNSNSFCITYYKARIEAHGDDGSPSGEETVANSLVATDLMDTGNDFRFEEPDIEDILTPKIPPIANWYGLREFVVVARTDEDIRHMSEIKSLQSCIQLAISDTDCLVPVFLRVMNKKRNIFLGIFDYGAIRTSFDMICLQKLPSQTKCYTGLLNMFKGKADMGHTGAVKISIKINFQTNEVVKYEDIMSKGDAVSEFPFGLNSDPVVGFEMGCVWPEMYDSAVFLSNKSNFDPMSAGVWVVKPLFDENAIEQMTEVLDEYLENSSNDRTLLDLSNEGYKFGGAKTKQKSASIFSESPLLKLSHLVRNEEGAQASKSGLSSRPISDAILQRMLYFLFPDADEETLSPYVVQENPVGVLSCIQSLTYLLICCFDLQAISNTKMKTAPEDSLVHRLALLLAIANSCFGEIDGLKQLWLEFFMELRYRVDRGIEIPG